MHCRKRTTLISHQQRRPWLANGMLDVWLHGIPLFRSVTTVVSACQGLHGLYRKPSTEATRKYLSTSSKAGYSTRGFTCCRPPSSRSNEILLHMGRDGACHPKLSSTCQPMLRIRMPLSRRSTCALPLPKKIIKSTRITQTNYLAI
jgi:hypothetical protein